MRAQLEEEVRCCAQGMVQAGGVVAAIFHARFALFEVLQQLNGGRPTEALLLGCLLLGVALGCAPIMLLQYSQVQPARRVLVLTAALGMLLVMLRPPLPTKVPLLGWLLSRVPSRVSAPNVCFQTAIDLTAIPIRLD